MKGKRKPTGLAAGILRLGTGFLLVLGGGMLLGFLAAPFSPRAAGESQEDIPLSLARLVQRETQFLMETALPDGSAGKAQHSLDAAVNSAEQQLSPLPNGSPAAARWEEHREVLRQIKDLALRGSGNASTVSSSTSRYRQARSSLEELIQRYQEELDLTETVVSSEEPPAAGPRPRFDRCRRLQTSLNALERLLLQFLLAPTADAMDRKALAMEIQEEQMDELITFQKADLQGILTEHQDLGGKEPPGSPAAAWEARLFSDFSETYGEVLSSNQRIRTLARRAGLGEARRLAAEEMETFLPEMARLLRPPTGRPKPTLPSPVPAAAALAMILTGGCLLFLRRRTEKPRERAAGTTRPPAAGPCQSPPQAIQPPAPAPRLPNPEPPAAQELRDLKRKYSRLKSAYEDQQEESREEIEGLRSQHETLQRQQEQQTAAVRRGKEQVEGTFQAVEASADLIQTMDEIARQTGLLALNAAIEAAHAGPYGRSFSVIAEEIRKLAARSRETADELQRLSRQAVDKAETAREEGKIPGSV